MGDMAEPRFATEETDHVPVMTKINSTLSRSFIKSKDYQDALRQSEVSLIF